jgi:hypothetical protein
MASLILCNVLFIITDHALCFDLILHNDKIYND